MGKPKVTRDDLLKIKKFITDRIITLIENDPVLRSEADADRYFADMYVSALRTFKPELKLWAMDVVIREVADE